MEIITKEKLNEQLKYQKKFLKTLIKERDKQEEKSQKAQSKEEIEKICIIDRELYDGETKVRDEIIIIEKLLKLGIKEIIRKL